MSIRFVLLSLFTLLSLAPRVAAQDPVDPRSPYSGQQSRAIKALSEEDVRGLLEGEGMGYALAAELNGWPGPRHVLDLADSLALTDDQRARVGGIHARMSASARSLGARLVDAEAELDATFTGGFSPSLEGLVEKVAEIARLTGDLRAVHLTAHVETRRALTGEQVARYVELRGYGPEAAGPEAGDHGPEGHDHGAGHGRGG